MRTKMVYKLDVMYSQLHSLVPIHSGSCSSCCSKSVTRNFSTDQKHVTFVAAAISSCNPLNLSFFDELPSRTDEINRLSQTFIYVQQLSKLLLSPATNNADMTLIEISWLQIVISGQSNLAKAA